MKTIVVKCCVCEKSFERQAKHVKEGKKRGWLIYCSKECRSIRQTTSEKFKCCTCGKEVYRTPSQEKRSKSGNIFCSRSCATVANNKLYKSGDNRPNYTNGLSSYRERALRVSSVCEICGYDIVEVLEVHHMDCDRGNNNLDNLMVVCPTHHKEYQLGIRK